MVIAIDPQIVSEVEGVVEKAQTQNMAKNEGESEEDAFKKMEVEFLIEQGIMTVETIQI